MPETQTKSNYNVDHVLKQKSKELPNGFIYSVVNGKTEMHSLDNVVLISLDNVELGQLLKNLIDENKQLKKILEAQKKAILLNKDRIEKLERKMKVYGLE